ncbi:hypothetical protein [Paenibacillus tianmuensis]
MSQESLGEKGGFHYSYIVRLKEGRRMSPY